MVKVDRLSPELVKAAQRTAQVNRCRQLWEAKKENKALKARADTAEEDLRKGRDALHQPEQERDEARAGHQQVPTGSAQTLPDPGTQQLCQELAADKQGLEHIRSQEGASTPVMDVAKLRSQLHEAQAALTAQRVIVPESALQNQVATLEQECQQAQGHVQELLNKGQALQGRYLELQNQKAAQEVQLNIQLKVARMEIDGLKKWVEMQSDFSDKRAAEITRLGGEVTRLQSKKVIEDQCQYIFRSLDPV